MKKLFFVFIFLSAFIAEGQSLEARVKEFDAYIEKSRILFQIPGISVAVVKDGKVLLSKGYGVRELGKPEPVNGQTLFACASTTKAMTATCMAMLVDEGKVKWDDPVLKYLPDFQLYDPYVTRELKIRDLFTHNSGVGNADFFWSTMRISSDEILSQMKLVKPSYSLRSDFIYQNIFYQFAGKVIEKVSGMPWEVFIQKRIFDPLKMTRTYPMLKLVNDVNQSSPHHFVNNKITIIQRTSADVIGPAGSVWSCADDMGKWAMCMLDSSKYAGGRLVKAATWNELFKPQVIVPANQFYPTMQLTKPNWTTYSLGWFQQDYKGMKVNFHTGSLAGETAIHGQLPESKLGIYVFGNLDHAEVRHALMFRAFDAFALGGVKDWSNEFNTLYTKRNEAAEQEVKNFESKRIMNTRPSVDMAAYAGTYTDPLFGELIITQQGNTLVCTLNNVVKATLEHWHYDTFRGSFEKLWWGKTNATFTLNTQGKVSKVGFEGMEFRRVP